ncbi:uncharacterized protein LOC101857424 [Aplysia californica]|uniref:Uncharacterized protein LOC101857424 n=1 Tax=Aplysia californica TaxID=6500 RepID=A0ABM0JWR7_APLCA|nr:uncharacterized protein LOC101857424 [Aplysia californica]XP_035826946.1 uncharacterized protein LOC101857424 [Aplysia californica]XP_035826947.1 uncharacterized protein LOC101857424 [Aplysia californica]XP_035826948.1 uncharacterized protein LOC101857424 [Aplysia californica]
MSLPPQSTSLGKVGLSISAIGLLIFIVGFACPYWLTTTIEIPVLGANHINVGLFKACNTFTGCESSNEPKDWQYATAGLEVLGLCLSLATVSGAILYVCVLNTTWVAKLKWSFIATGMLAGSAVIGGCVVFVLNRDNVSDLTAGIEYDIGWSFALGAVGGILQILSAGLFIVDCFV